MKLLTVLTPTGYVIGSVARHDYREKNGCFIDGGVPGINGDYTRHNGQLIWVEVPQSLPELYEDFQTRGFNGRKPRKYGIWKLKNVKILSQDEIPDTSCIEWQTENQIWGARAKAGKVKYSYLKELTSEHLEAIMDTQYISDKLIETIKFILNERRKTL